jgi:GxxExxY protein
MSNSNLRRGDLIYPELSYQLVGYAYEIFNELGYGHKELYYQRAFAQQLKMNNHKFVEQKYYPLKFKGINIGKSFIDFEVEEKVLVELKKDSLFSKARIDQVLDYLKISNKKLALLISFSSAGVRVKRIVNFDTH